MKIKNPTKLNQPARDGRGNTYTCIYASGEGWIWEYLARQLLLKETELKRIKMALMSDETATKKTATS